jgi:uncharacterized damage-inducible protein DinB
MTVMVERWEPTRQKNERDMLEGWLEYHRATLEWKCEGLTDEQLRTKAVPPSTMSLLGLVRHMADVELNWFRRVLNGEPIVGGDFWTPENEPEDPEFNFDVTATSEEAFGVWHDECERARAIAATKELDDVGLHHGTPTSLRWIYTHMIEEYARHNGHADLIRECIDGATGD